MPKRVRAARHYQRKDDPAIAIARAARPAVRRDIKGALSQLGKLVPEKALHHARAGDFVSLKHSIDWNHAREVFKTVFARVAKVREAGGKLGERKINGAFHQRQRGVHFRKAMAGMGVPEPVAWVASSVPLVIDDLIGLAAGGIELAKDVGGISGRFGFDVYDDATLQRIADARNELLTMVEDGARGAIDVIIANAARSGASAEDVTDYIRGLIGLNARQAQAVLNYEQGLIDDGTLDADGIAALVSDYVDRSLDYRAAMIAQTETTRAANAGLHDAYSQAIDRGVMPGEAVMRFWQLGDSPCEICESIPDNEPDGVGVDDTFTSIEGEEDDPPVHPNCECSVEYVTDVSMVPEE